MKSVTINALIVYHGYTHMELIDYNKMLKKHWKRLQS